MNIASAEGGGAGAPIVPDAPKPLGTQAFVKRVLPMLPAIAVVSVLWALVRHSVDPVQVPPPFTSGFFAFVAAFGLLVTIPFVVAIVVGRIWPNSWVADASFYAFLVTLLVFHDVVGPNTADRLHLVPMLIECIVLVAIGSAVQPFIRRSVNKQPAATSG